MFECYDRNCNPITLETWTDLHADFEYIVVKKTKVGFAEVSTVWLGMNHSVTPNTAPLIFETMVFGGPESELCERYSTEEEALAGHTRIVAMLKEKE